LLVVIKKALFILLFLTLWMVFSPMVKAQVVPAVVSNVAYADISCVVVSPIGIIKLQDMNFGSIISGQAGAVTLSPNGGVPTTSGNVMIETSGSVVSTATFSVSDSQENSAKAVHYFTGYTITLPANEIILANESGQTMRVGNFTSIPSASTFGTFTNGAGTVSIGATLYVNALQGLGKYSSTTSFPVTVNYY
jgi:hypothetical protein